MRPHMGWLVRKCESCGAAFQFKVARMKQGTPGRFCSLKCLHAWMRGRKMSDTPRDEMARLYREEGWTMPRLAEHFGMSLSTIGHHLNKAGVQRRPPSGANLRWPETQAKIAAGLRRGTAHPHYRAVPMDRVMAEYQAGHSTLAIARHLGVSDHLIQTRLQQAGIPLRASGFGRQQLARDGHPVRSGWERIVDDWLTDQGIEHTVEPRIPFAITKWCADFFARGHYLEVWGVEGSRTYDAKRAAKEAHYRRYRLLHLGITPAELGRQDFSALAPLHGTD